MAIKSRQNSLPLKRFNLIKFVILIGKKICKKVLNVKKASFNEKSIFSKQKNSRKSLS